MANSRLKIEYSKSTKFTVSRGALSNYLSNILRRLEGADRLDIVVDKRPLGDAPIAMVAGKRPSRHIMPCIEVIITEEEQIKKLNQRYFNRPVATDVLSFPQVEGAGSAGSIVVCASLADKQARQGGISLHEQINHLVGHGLLHLLGYNHQ